MPRPARYMLQPRQLFGFSSPLVALFFVSGAVWSFGDGNRRPAPIPGRRRPRSSRAALATAVIGTSAHSTSVLSVSAGQVIEPWGRGGRG